MSGRPKKRTGFHGKPTKKCKPNSLNAEKTYPDNVQSVSISETDLNEDSVISNMETVDQVSKPSSSELLITAFRGNILDENVPTPFLPINESWQNNMCNLFGIKLHNVHHIISAENAGKPSLTKQIKGDWNCFYRAISFLISGMEENHIIVCVHLLQHML